MNASARQKSNKKHAKHNTRFFYYTFCVLLLLVAAAGGSSRPDMVQLLVLRPGLVLLFGFALWHQNEDSVRRVRVPLFLLLALGAWMLIQLIPLPPAIWSALPGRSLEAQTTALAGTSADWHPISLSPLRTWNSLVSLLAPVTALLLAGCMPRGEQRRLLPLLLIIGGVTVLLGMLQRVGPANSELYFYEITNAGSAVGLFANRNHQGAFLAALIPAAVIFALMNLQGIGARFAGPIIATVILGFGAVLTGSRGGVILTGVALLLTFALCAGVLIAAASGLVLRSVRRWLVPLAGVAILLLAVGWFAFGQRLAGEWQLLTGEFRYQALPLYVDMAVRNFPVGTGFGAFERAYLTVEPFEFLGTAYLNHAHNDLLELLLEGGLPAAVLLVIFLIWWVRASARAILNSDERLEGADAAGVAITFILMIASLFDYPLRAPLLMVVFAVGCASLAGSGTVAPRSRVAGRQTDGRRNPDEVFTGSEPQVRGTANTLRDDRAYSLNGEPGT